jgi:hypothetical protein
MRATAAPPTLIRVTPSPARQFVLQRAQRVRRTAVRLARPLTEALVTGAPDPARPRSPRLVLRVPRALGLLPFQTMSLVLLGDLALTCVLFGGGLSYLQTEAAAARSPLDQEGLMFAALAFSLPLALRDRWPLAAWRSAFLLVPLGTVVSRQFLHEVPYTAAVSVTYTLVVYAAAVRCERHIAVGVWIFSVLGAWILHRDSMVLVTGVVTASVLFGYNVRTRRLAQEERRSERALAAQAALED